MKLKKLTIENFKGIKSLEISFSEKTSISGQNATGKTTIFDAYSWLLWDKDSLNRKDFGIKPYDLNGSTKSIDSMVTGILEVDGKSIELCKVYKEVWTKKRGQTQATFTGNTTEYFINSVPVKKSEYNSRISTIIDEKEFNLLSNPLYFNQILDKKERREVLLGLIKDIDKDDVIKANESLKMLDLENYSIDEIRAMAKATSKKINDDIKSLPARIDELEKSKNTYNFESIEKNKEKLETRLDEIEKALSKGTSSTELIAKKNAEIQGFLDRQRELKRATDDLNDKKRRELYKSYEDRKEAFEYKKGLIRRQLIKTNESINNLSVDIKLSEIRVEKSDIQLDSLRQSWINTNSSEFKGSLDCPTCGRPLEEHDQTDIIANFNKNRSEELENIENEAKLLSKTIEEHKSDLEELKIKYQDYKNVAAELQKEHDQLGDFTEEKPTFIEELVPVEYIKLQEEIDKIKEELKNIDGEDNTELINEQKRIKNDLESINNTLGLRGQNESLNERIEAYKAKEKELATEYEKQIQILDLCDEYTRTFTELVSAKINDLFDYVSFKLFDTQVNGGLVETCEVTIDGVPYSDINNAAKINAGIDVINTLSKHLDIEVPIFVDNAESVNEIRDTDSQLVKLIVSEDEELKIKGA